MLVTPASGSAVRASSNRAQGPGLTVFVTHHYCWQPTLYHSSKSAVRLHLIPSRYHVSIFRLKLIVFWRCLPRRAVTLPEMRSDLRFWRVENRRASPQDMPWPIVPKFSYGVLNYFSRSVLRTYRVWKKYHRPGHRWRPIRFRGT